MTKFASLALLASVLAAPAFAAPMTNTTAETKTETTTPAPVADHKLGGAAQGKISGSKTLDTGVVHGNSARVKTESEVKDNGAVKIDAKEAK